MISKAILEDLMKDSPCVRMGICDNKNGHWCILRELIPYISIDGRMAEQIGLMYDYKYMASEKEGIDIGQERAFTEFAIKYGARFAEVYQDGMTNRELFEKVFGFKKKHTDKDIEEHLTLR